MKYRNDKENKCTSRTAHAAVSVRSVAGLKFTTSRLCTADTKIAGVVN